MKPGQAWILAAVTAVSVAAGAAPPSPADAVKARINAYRELGAAMKGVNDGLRGSDVQTVAIQQYARQIRNAARQQYGWFPAGSGPQPGVKTAAKPDIWARAAQFKAAQDNFARQADAFQRVAATGNPEPLRAAARTLGTSCKSCHDQFRAPKD